MKNVIHQAQTFQHEVELVDRQYSSPVRQMRAKKHLAAIRVSEFVRKGDDPNVTLAKVYRPILKRFRQVPLYHRGEAHKKKS